MIAVFRTRKHILPANAVRRNHRHQIGRRMSLHTPSPVLHAVTFQNRLAPDRGRIEQKLRTLHRQTSGRLREPLIPADSDSDTAEFRIKYPKSRISRSKIELLLIIMIIRNMRLAVYAKILPVRVNHRDAVEQPVTVPLKKADRKHRTQLLRNFREMPHRVILSGGLCEAVILISALLAEVLSFEQLRKQNDIRSPSRRFPRQRFCSLNIFKAVGAAPHLHRRRRHLSQPGPSFLFCGICCVIQWMLPPPVRISLAGIGYIFRSGKHSERMLTACASFSSPNCGTITPPFEM